jgi:hypothetical protein
MYVRLCVSLFARRALKGLVHLFIGYDLFLGSLIACAIDICVCGSRLMALPIGLWLVVYIASAQSTG